MLPAQVQASPSSLYKCEVTSLTSIKHYFEIRKFEHGVLLFATRWKPNVKNEKTKETLC